MRRRAAHLVQLAAQFGWQIERDTRLIRLQKLTPITHWAAVHQRLTDPITDAGARWRNRQIGFSLGHAPWGTDAPATAPTRKLRPSQRHRLIDQGNALPLRHDPLRIDQFEHAALQSPAVQRPALTLRHGRLNLGNTDPAGVRGHDGFDQLQFVGGDDAGHGVAFSGNLSRSRYSARLRATVFMAIMSLKMSCLQVLVSRNRFGTTLRPSFAAHIAVNKSNIRRNRAYQFVLAVGLRVL